jgi:hypothetical protein
LLFSNREMNDLDDSIALVFTEERKSEAFRDSTISRGVIGNLNLIENNQFLINNSSPLKLVFHSEMDDFIKNIGMNNVKI